MTIWHPETLIMMMNKLGWQGGTIHQVHAEINKMTTQDKLTLLSLLTQFDTLKAMADENRLTPTQEVAMSNMIQRDIEAVLKRQSGKRQYVCHGAVIEATLLTQHIGEQ